MSHKEMTVIRGLFIACVGIYTIAACRHFPGFSGQVFSDVLQNMLAGAIAAMGAQTMRCKMHSPARAKKSVTKCARVKIRR